MDSPTFDSEAFGAQVREAVQRRAGGSMREAARQAGVSVSTVSRVCSGWPDLSHKSWLRLDAWMAGLEEAQAA